MSIAVFDAVEDMIWKALAKAYKLKKEGLPYDEIIFTVKSVLQ